MEGACSTHQIRYGYKFWLENLKVIEHSEEDEKIILE
jgi:hypothetical protein